MRRVGHLVPLLLLAWAACGDPQTPTPAPPDDPRQADSATEPSDPEQLTDDAAARADASASIPKADASVEPMVPAQPLRFVALGDGGSGDDAQKKVAAAMARVCKERGCEFALYLGDNIYDTGVNGVDDEQFQLKFEEPYAELGFPFYVALGNHDYGNFGLNISPDDARSAAQVEYTAHSDKWNMPHYYYAFEQGQAAFFALDTNAIVMDQFRGRAEQQSWLDREMAASKAPWKIVFGHHPYISNGGHGNAGEYGYPFGFELHSGATLKELVDESVCGRANLFLAGHDHHREWLEPTCGTTFIVSGAAAKLRAVGDTGSPALWADDQKRGFLWIEIDGDVLTGVFFDDEGEVDFEHVIMR